ncbi:penicillin-binding protein 1C [Betaproteobacteria bacterium GR16-43]|nr:penicillin-binding protein 1C [Betaproteobacteria bacterium GR16-43]
MRLMLAGSAAASLVVAIGFASSFAVAPYPVAAFTDVRSQWRAADAWLLDRHGEPLSRVRIDRERRRGEWVALGDVSPALVDSVVASEDKRFRGHEGVDWLGMLGAARQTGLGERRGGSTLTMQVAAYLEPSLELGGQRNLVDKWRQMRQALAIERTWSKGEILEAWLNLTPFRGEIEGVDAASRAIMGKRAAGLDSAEAALLAVLARSPNAPADRVARRACALAGHDELVCNKARYLADLGFGATRVRPRMDGDAPHLARKLLATAGERRPSSLDAELQRFAAQSLGQHLRELNGRNVEDGAVVVLDNASGEVLAYVGSSGDLSRAPEVDGAAARRLAGSTLKPFLYSLAIERRLLTAASILDDSPLAVTTTVGLYVPQNYDRSFKGKVTLRQALAASLNVPAVRTLALVGYEPFHARLRDVGLKTLDRDADHYGYGLALGGGEVTLLDLANAYRTLANGGRYSRVGFVPGTAPSEGVRVIDERAAFVVSDVLADPAARAVTFGLASPLATRYRASVKTGTSKDMRDNWAVGYTNRFTVAVWVGNFSGDAMHDVSGVTGAAPVWRDVMDHLQEGIRVDAPRAPEGVVHSHVRFAGELEPARDEWFLAGTQSEEVVAVAAPAGRPHLESPANGAIYAIDPDIPRSNQRILLRAKGTGEGERFLLPDGREIDATRPVLWNLVAGRHQVALRDAAGRVIDRASFEVR